MRRVLTTILLFSCAHTGAVAAFQHAVSPPGAAVPEFRGDFRLVPAACGAGADAVERTYPDPAALTGAAVSETVFREHLAAAIVVGGTEVRLTPDAAESGRLSLRSGAMNPDTPIAIATPPAPSSLTLGLGALGCVGALQLSRTARRLQWGGAPEWMFACGPGEPDRTADVGLGLESGGLWAPHEFGRALGDLGLRAPLIDDLVLCVPRDPLDPRLAPRAPPTFAC